MSDPRAIALWAIYDDETRALALDTANRLGIGPEGEPVFWYSMHLLNPLDTSDQWYLARGKSQRNTLHHLPDPRYAYEKGVPVDERDPKAVIQYIRRELGFDGEVQPATAGT